MSGFKSVLFIVCCLCLFTIDTCNGDERLTSGTPQEEKKEKINNIPDDPGGTDTSKLTPEDTPVQNGLENRNGQADDKKAQTQEQDDSSKPKLDSIKSQSDKDPVPESKQSEEVETNMIKEEIKSQEETAKQAAPIGNLSQTVTTHQGTDDSEAVAQPAGDQANTETIIQPGPAEQEAPKQGEEIQTFTEWTQKVLEEEKQKTAATETPGSSVTKSKRSINYASKECGAKVLASNPEAENIKAVLTSNKDEYMINPCKVAKKWFVIELCEPVHVSHFEVASFELFSSQPKTFRVYLSDRYPAKEWINIGEEVATEERTSQTFSIKEGYIVQFVKVEMLDHYGTEHFCPLTWFKVYGIPVEYDEYGHRSNEDHDDNNNDMDEVLLHNGETTEDTDTPKNLFTSATDTVMKLVKKVLNVEDKKKPSDSGKNTTDQVKEKLNDTQKNLTEAGFPLPCLPNKTKKEEVKVEGQMQPSPPHPNTGFVTAPTDTEDSIKQKDVSMVTKLEDHEQVPSVSDAIVTLIDNEEEDTVSCDITTATLATLSYFRKPICRYYDLINYSENYPTCSLNESASKLHIESIGNEDSKASGEADVKQSSDEIQIIPAVTRDTNSVSKTESRTELKDVKQPEVTSAKILSSIQEPQMSTTTVTSNQMEQTTASSASIQPSSSSSAQVESMKTITDKTENEADKLLGEKSLTQEANQDIQPSSPSTSEHVKSIDPTPSLGESSIPQKTVDFVLVDTATTPSTTQTEQVTESIKVQPEVPLVDEASKVEVEQPPSQKINASETDGPSTELFEPVVVGDNVPAVQDPKDLRLVHVPVLPYQKRETAIMRLNNRLKSLEMNVSLSSRFLEEMSRKFKKQTEDMIKQHVFNKTVGEITNVTQAIEIQSRIQKQKIDVLETKIQNLTDVVLRLSENLDSLNKQVQDREFKYIVTIVIFCIAVLILMRRKSPKIPPEKEPAPFVPNPSPVRRRNSYSGCEHERIDNIGPAIQKYHSESTLVNNKSFSSSIDPGGSQNHHVKKKKKKKQKMDQTSFTCEDKISSHKTGYNSAGLLFGTSSRETTLEDKKTKSMTRAQSYGGIWSLFASDKQEQLKPKGPDKKDSLVNCHPKSNGCIPKKSVKAGKICHPVKQSNGCIRKSRSGSFNGFDNHSSDDDDVDGNNSLLDNNTNNSKIFIVSPLKKGFSFSKATSQNSHKDPLLRSYNGKHGRTSHMRTGSTDLTKSVSFKEMNGH